MRRRATRLLVRAKRRFTADCTADPWMKYILLLAALLTGFFFWHRIPGFATIDERWRLIDVLQAVGIFATDPGLDSISPAVLTERFAGATLYLYGIALVPVFVAVAVSGQLSGLAGVSPRLYPEWVWTWSLLLGRFTVVVIAVGCVYLTYRIGTATRDRTTGRLAAVLLTLTFGFLVMAHEVGEDVPAMFCLLVVFALALRYVETGDETAFLTGCVAGGFAIAFKLTAGVSVVVLTAAYLLRARNTRNERGAVFKPRLVGLGAAFGAGAVVIGHPEVLVAGPDVLVARMFEQASQKTLGLGGPAAPIWWWLLRNYLSSLGLPLFIASLGGVAAGVVRLRERSTEAHATVLALAGIAVYLIAYSRWEYVRLHHLLPTFPLLALLIAIWLSRLHSRNRNLARPLIAALLVTSGTYAVVGDFQYATAPRDEAAAWLNAHAPDDATMEVYRIRYRDAVFPRGMEISSYQRVISQTGSSDRQRTRTTWMLDMPRRCPTYIQLTYWDLTYLNAASPSQTQPVPWVAQRGDSEPPWMPNFSAPRRTEYIHNLLTGGYSYTVAAEFGPRPSLWPQPRLQTSPVDLLHAGVYPWTITYGDDQDLRAEQYTLILERTGSCERTRDPKRSNGSRLETSTMRT
ncbi:ArnT family glycosyltransferase [Halococcus sp. AFM35]|uniref:ArnT family glycosyltransferase n=1 Tax=Halococcus sp. AFM35 TaxID=3421653 RepID=UPI003EBFEAE4